MAVFGASRRIIALSSAVETTVIGQLAVFAERVVEKFAHFAAALADQSDDHAVEARARTRAWRATVDLPTPEPAKTPMRWPAQSGVKKSMTRTPLLIGRLTRSRRHRRRRLGVDRRRTRPLDQRPEAIDRRAQRVDHAAFPRAMRLQAHRPGAEGEIADAGLDPRVEGFDRHARRVDPDHFAGRARPETGDADDVAELEVARQAGDAKGRGTDLGDDAADAHRIERCKLGFLDIRQRCNGLLPELSHLTEASERNNGRPQAGCRRPAVLIASLKSSFRWTGWRCRRCRRSARRRSSWSFPAPH